MRSIRITGRTGSDGAIAERKCSGKAALQLEFEVPPLDTTSHATSHGRRATPSAYALLLFDFGCSQRCVRGGRGLPRTGSLRRVRIGAGDYVRSKRPS